MNLRKIPLALFMVVSPLAFAADTSVINVLKSTPLTAYEAGKFKLESLALIVGIAQKKKKDAINFNVIEKRGMLGVEIKTAESARNMSDSNCDNELKKLSGKLDVNKIPGILWPNLVREQKIKVMSELFVTLTLEAEENNTFSISCTKTLSQLAKK